jgi:hypothetical protein
MELISTHPIKKSDLGFHFFVIYMLGWIYKIKHANSLQNNEHIK